ncbi:MAG: BlaI/MecI/CopY family transcriptional regulator [Planctomycetes bacterium]|nr:BlaI/MecI/CopY family transcriptional regulator [Planctomycetota bacterium]
MDHPALTNAELAVMELLWDRGRLTARQIREALYPEAEKAQHGTVQRFLQSLEEKGCVARDRDLPVHLFAAAISRATYAGRQLESLADKLTGGSIAPFLTHLLAERKISRSELDRLRALLEGDQRGAKSHD